ncbi:MAG: hypothetical protein GY760_12210, partial [Deltaproteobacteria bacterium]|nr:hypothetical protein [Deltaproteobacteria bacterium]
MLLIPETTEGNGTGHLKRMVRLSGELTGRVYIFIEPSEMIRLNNFLSNEKELNIVDAVQNLNEFEKIIVDKKAITTDFFNKYLKG